MLSVLTIAMFAAVYRYRTEREVGVAFMVGLLSFVAVHGFAESLFKLPTFLFFILVTCLFRLASLPSLNVNTRPDSGSPVVELS